MSETEKTYSIMLRLRRITYEHTYVGIPVTDAIMMEKDDGRVCIDPNAFANEAIRISNDPHVIWEMESTQVEPHPIQQVKPEDKAHFDPSMNL